MTIVYLNTFKITQWTLYFNFIRYYGVFIKNTFHYPLPSTVTQFIRNILSAYNLICRSKSLLTLVQAQYFFKIERLHNEAA